MSFVSLLKKFGITTGFPGLAAGLCFAAACAQPTPVAEPGPTPAQLTPASPTAGLAPTPTSGPSLVPTPTSRPSPVPTETPTPQPELAPVRLEIGEGTEARYLVREQFAQRNVPNDAIGRTREVSGTIYLNGSGEVVAEESFLQVDLSSLRSDEDDRDDYLRGESLESDRYPLAEFVVTETPGLPWPLPTEGEGSFQLAGDMTIHGTTSPLVWEVTAQFASDGIVGTARTNFEFDTFHLVRPTRFFLLSVEDNIRLELDFVVSVGESGPVPSETSEPGMEETRFETGPCAMTRAAQMPIEFEYAGTIPTGFDGINQANCTFTRPVATITVVLTGPATHRETFTLEGPSAEVRFPLPEGTLSVTTSEIVPPGEYQREMTATSIDGDTLLISGQPAVLSTVTILGPRN